MVYLRIIFLKKMDKEYIYVAAALMFVGVSVYLMKSNDEDKDD